MTKENKHRRFQQKGPKEPNVKALKEHVLGGLQRRNLAHSSRRERNFIIERNYFGFVNKNERERESKKRGIYSNKRLL